MYEVRSLKGHLFDNNIIEDSACQCGFVKEDEMHYFFVCPLYKNERIILQDNFLLNDP